MLRVADVPGSATAGMSGFMLSSAAELQRRGHSVTFWFRDQLSPGVRTPGLRRLFVPWLIAAKVLDSQVRGQRFDVVEIHEPLAAPYGLLARLLRSRLPVCAILSFGLEDRSWDAHVAQLRAHGRRVPPRSRILVPLTLIAQANLGLRTAETVLVASSQDREHLIHRIGVPAERVCCAFTGVGERLFEVEPASGSEARVLFLGSWIERKGTVELLDAWRRLSTARPDARLTIAGVGDAERARYDTRGLSHLEVVAAVSRDELPDLLARHNIFVLPSSFEGLPLAMLEGAAAGLACIVSSVCGNLDVFRPEAPERDGALLVPPNDAEALHAALMRLVDDASLRTTLGSRARERAREFTWGANADQSLGAYMSALERHGSQTTTIAVRA